MFSFKANIVKRRRISKVTLLMGLLSAALLGYIGITYLEMGLVPIIENLIRQIGLNAYAPFVYLGIVGLLVFAVLPAIRSLFRKKTIVNGVISFDEENLKIIKGKEKFLIPQEQLQELNFELKPLSEVKKKRKANQLGGNYMRIPTKKGVFECELDIESDDQKLELLNMAEFLKIQHDVKVKIKELK